jgi:hypothetical protein
LGKTNALWNKISGF